MNTKIIFEGFVEANLHLGFNIELSDALPINVLKENAHKIRDINVKTKTDSFVISNIKSMQKLKVSDDEYLFKIVGDITKYFKSYEWGDDDMYDRPIYRDAKETFKDKTVYFAGTHFCTLNNEHLKDIIFG